MKTSKVVVPKPFVYNFDNTSMYNVPEKIQIHLHTEKFHKSIQSTTFENYLHSEELEDSWLIRSIINVSKDQIINDDNFDEVCNILNQVNIVDIKNIDSLIDDMFNECHLITRQDVLPHQIILNKNETSIPKIDFSQLNHQTQGVFLKRTGFDRKLYNKYCK